MKVGQQVKVLTDQEFIRCGYQLGLNHGIAAIKSNLDTIGKINQLIIDQQEINKFQRLYYDRQFDKIIRELAYVWIKERGFGGNERSIHTRTLKELNGHISPIIDKKRVVTGHRNPGYVSRSLFDYEDEPPTLEDQKHHIILQLYHPVDIYSVWVEASKCELIQ